MTEIVYCWFVGIDWGEKTHQVCLCNASGEVRGSRAFSHNGRGLEALVRWLRKQTGAAPATVAVAIERPDGPVVATLREAGFCVHALNPRQSNRLREIYSHAGNKDDELDARVLAWGLRSNTAVFRRVQGHPELIERLRERTRTADKLLREKVRQCQRIRNSLLDYFPQMLAVAGDMQNLGKPFFVELWERAPTPAAARKLRRSTLMKLMKRYGIARIGIEQVFALFREEPLVVSPGATEAAVERIRTALTLLKVLNAEIARAEEQLTAFLDALSEIEEVGGGPAATGPDLVSVLRSRKGLGDKALARLFAWAFEALRSGNYRRLRAACGVIPRRIQSGKFERAALRRSVPNSLQQAAYLLAGGVVRWDEKVSAYNRKLKAEGKKPARRYRSIADQQFRVLCAMVRTRTFFDPDFPSRRSAA